MDQIRGHTILGGHMIGMDNCIKHLVDNQGTILFSDEGHQVVFQGGEFNYKGPTHSKWRTLADFWLFSVFNWEVKDENL